MHSDPTVYVVDDDAAVLNSISWLLESASHRVETFSSGLDFLEKYTDSSPGCLLLDIRMPGMGGLEVQEVIRNRRIDIPIVIISGHADVTTAVRALKAGAVDFIEKPFSDQHLLEKIAGALEEDVRRRRNRAEEGHVVSRIESLTPREREVMDLVVDGNSNKQIAEVLSISNKTVEAHRAKVMRKMEAGSLADLVRNVLSVAR